MFSNHHKFKFIFIGNFGFLNQPNILMSKIVIAITSLFFFVLTTSAQKPSDYLSFDIGLNFLNEAQSNSFIINDTIFKANGMSYRAGMCYGLGYVKSFRIEDNIYLSTGINFNYVITHFTLENVNRLDADNDNPQLNWINEGPFRMDIAYMRIPLNLGVFLENGVFFHFGMFYDLHLYSKNQWYNNNTKIQVINANTALLRNNPIMIEKKAQGSDYGISLGIGQAFKFKGVNTLTLGLDINFGLSTLFESWKLSKNSIQLRALIPLKGLTPKKEDKEESGSDEQTELIQF